VLIKIGKAGENEAGSQSVFKETLHTELSTRARSVLVHFDGHTFIKLLLAHYTHGSSETFLRKESSVQQIHDNTTHLLATANVML